MKDYIIWTAGKYLRARLEMEAVADGLGERAIYYMER